MGDLSSSESSWKKMVIAKANNKWVSTIKLDDSNMDNTSETDTEHQQVFHSNIKNELAESYEENDNNESSMALTQEMDPLSILEVAPRKRRQSSTSSKCESPEERASRLAKMSAYAAQRLANESPDQRAVRLKRMSEYAAKRLAHETSEQRAKRLSRMSAYAAKRLANESPEQRQARLARMSAYAARRQAMKKVTSSSSAEFSDNPLQVFKNMQNQS